MLERHVTGQSTGRNYLPPLVYERRATDEV